MEGCSLHDSVPTGLKEQEVENLDVASGINLFQYWRSFLAGAFADSEDENKMDA